MKDNQFGMLNNYDSRGASEKSLYDGGVDA